MSAVHPGALPLISEEMPRGSVGDGEAPACADRRNDAEGIPRRVFHGFRQRAEAREEARGGYRVVERFLPVNRPA